MRKLTKSSSPEGDIPLETALANVRTSGSAISGAIRLLANRMVLGGWNRIGPYWTPAALPGASATLATAICYVWFEDVSTAWFFGETNSSMLSD